MATAATSQPRKDYDDDIYPMRSEVRGVCLIIANEHFGGSLPDRIRTDQDKDALVKTFGNLGFNVKCFCDQTSRQMIDIMQSEARDPAHEGYDCFVACILSYGSDGLIYGVDGIPVKIKDLTGVLKPWYCPHLTGKPKLFFIQADQGKIRERGYECGNDVIPGESDIFVSYSSPPGYVSWRHTRKGSRYIRHLTECLDRYANSDDLIHIMVRMMRGIANEGDAERKQIPTVYSTLRKQFYLKTRVDDMFHNTLPVITREEEAEAEAVNEEGEEPRLDPTQFNINTQSDVDDFMHSIHEGFLRLVEPQQCKDLFDQMEQEDLLADTDRESLSAKAVYIRKEQARHLWFLLRKMPPEGFKKAVLPFLCEYYPHIIPPRWKPHGTQQHSYCLRHHIEGKVRQDTMIDMLFSFSYINIERYESIQKEKETPWAELFKILCERQSDDVTGLSRLLIRYKLSVPGDLPYLVSRGLRCTCGKEGHARPPRAVADEKVGEWLDRNDVDSNSDSSAGYPRDDRSVMDMISTFGEPDPELKEWAKRHGLDDVIVETLVRQDFVTLDDVKKIPASDVNELFLKYSLLTVKQCLLLKDALTSGFMPSKQTVETRDVAME